MPATAVQLPYVRDPASRTGRSLFRKQILPVGDVAHPDHGGLSFTPARLAAIRERFLAGAMDCVPFVLVDGENRHTDDPERARGEVKGLELTADGLYATIEASDRGAQLLADSPNLPVSVRLKTLADGSEVLAHVAGTHDPVAKGMRTWEAIDAAAGITVQDFSDRGAFRLPHVTPETAAPPAAPSSAPEALSPEEVGKFRAFLSRFTGSGDTPPAEPTPVTPPAPAATVTPASAPAAPPAPAIVPTPALALSDEDKSKLDMSHTGMLDLTARLGVSELAGKLDAYMKAGVPPALVNAARTSLLGLGTVADLSDTQKAAVIDLANGKDNPASAALFAALDAAKGTIDFSEKGTTTTVDMSDEARKAEQKMCDAAAEVYR